MVLERGAVVEEVKKNPLEARWTPYVDDRRLREELFHGFTHVSRVCEYHAAAAESFDRRSPEAPDVRVELVNEYLASLASRVTGFEGGVLDEVYLCVEILQDAEYPVGSFFVSSRRGVPDADSFRKRSHRIYNLVCRRIHWERGWITLNETVEIRSHEASLKLKASIEDIEKDVIFTVQGTGVSGRQSDSTTYIQGAFYASEIGVRLAVVGGYNPLQIARSFEDLDRNPLVAD